MRMHPHKLMFEYLVPNWWNYLGRFKKCAVVKRDITLGTGKEGHVAARGMAEGPISKMTTDYVYGQLPQAALYKMM